MKKVILVFTLLLATLAGQAQGSDYRPMVTEGKTWRVYVTRKIMTGGTDFPYVVFADYQINGKTEVDGVSCYRLYGRMQLRMDNTDDHQFLCYIYEADRKVYVYRDNQWEMEFDFTLQDGDQWEGHGVGKEDRTIGTQQFHTWVVNGDRWVEGVGSLKYGPLRIFPFKLPFSDKDSSECYAVYDGNDCLFDFSDGVRPLDELNGIVMFRATIDGLQYILNLNSHKAMIDNGNSWDGELVIPSEVTYQGETYTVTSVSWLAFSQCKSLTRVTIPKTIQTIHHYVDYEDCKNPFIGCTSLEAIVVEEGNESMCAVDGVLFSKDMTKLYCYPAGAKRAEYTIPESVTWIGGSCFSDNQALQVVHMPNTVQRTSFNTFSNCTNLEQVTLSDQLKYISAQMFCGCTSLKEVTLPNSITNIDEYAFYECRGLTKIVLPEGVRSVGGQAFRSCTSLRSAVLPSTLSTVSNWMFFDCTSLTSVIVPSGVTGISDGSFNGCTSLRTLDLPESVNRVGKAFDGCRLDALIIRGKISWNQKNGPFVGMNTSSVIYTLPAQVNKLKEVYAGNVLPLSDYQAGISTVTLSPSAHSQQLFDLQGRRLAAPPAKGVYIQGGRLKIGHGFTR